MTKHTPGPWRIETDDLGTFHITAGDRCYESVVAIVGTDVDDANLIVRAPNLLAQLERDYTVFQSLLLIGPADPDMEKALVSSVVCIAAEITRAGGTVPHHDRWRSPQPEEAGK